jgi:hypothetical protein
MYLLIYHEQTKQVFGNNFIGQAPPENLQLGKKCLIPCGTHSSDGICLIATPRDERVSEINVAISTFSFTAFKYRMDP